ncbi:MAG: mandelate racemase/muconate lactonizing enzyme family protein [Alphaproteobacteria bacterium]|nr:mandelate racemase/muconate lactonizing enzyme family protein [Alphaproteobacteria bacterium]
MKIVNLRTAIVTRTYETDARNTRHAWSHKSHVLVEIVADNGLSGLGEVYGDGIGVPQVMETVLATEIAPFLVGEDPWLVERLRECVAERSVLSGRAATARLAMAGVDIALWDLLGKTVGQPVYRLLGGHSDRASVYGSGGMFGPSITPQSLAEEMARAVRSGLGGVKIKGAAAGIDEDVARAAAVREAIGGERLMVDLMFAPDVPGALRWARALEPFGLHFLEAPTAAADIRGWARVRDAARMPLAGPELEWSTDVMRDFLLADAVDLLQFDVALAGGISQGRELAALARGFHKPISLHCAGTAVTLAASAHLAAASANCDSVEFHLMHQSLFERLWAADWKLEAGALVIPDRPGLGLDFTLDDVV